MGCSSCNTKDGKPGGCKGNGSCSTGGCNRMNVFPWISEQLLPVDQGFHIVEVSFSKGNRKEFFQLPESPMFETGDWVAVQAQFGQDIGQITLSGELVKAQLLKKGVKDTSQLGSILRHTTEDEMDAYWSFKEREKEVTIQARVIAYSLGLDMKMGNVEFQGDGKKITFYYSADDRVDFRELIKVYAQEFKTKIEMRQIGARQEAAKVGGIGACGRELCCSSWLTSFSSVNTQAARYQQLSINQSKLSGQCGRLKCCLNYELDTYLDALSHFPKRVEVLKLAEGTSKLLKLDIFKGLMYYTNPKKSGFKALTIERVNEIKAMNERGEFPETLQDDEPVVVHPLQKSIDHDLAGQISLDSLEKAERQKRRKKRPKPKRNPNQPTGQNEGRPNQKTRSSDDKRPQGKRKPRPQQEGNKEQPEQANQKPRSREDKKPRPQRTDNRENPNNKEQSGERKPRPQRQNKGPRPQKQGQSEGPNEANKGPRPTKGQSTEGKPEGDRPKKRRNPRRKPPQGGDSAPKPPKSDA